MAKNKSATSEDQKQTVAHALFGTPVSSGQLGGAPAVPTVNLPVDADVHAFFRRHKKNYQAHMNKVLRREMESQTKGK